MRTGSLLASWPHRDTVKRLHTLDMLVCRGGLVLGGVALVLLMGIMGLHVLLRLAGRPMAGAHEICGLLGALSVACALADAQQRKVHVTVDIVSRRFPATVQKLLAALNALLFAAFYGVLGGMVGRHALAIRARGELSETLKMAFHPFVLALAAGLLLLAFTLLLEVVGAVSFRRSPAPAAVVADAGLPAEAGEPA